MKGRYYVAYGSNLSVEQMARRCRDAKVVGMGVLKDWKLEFRLHANIRQCAGEQVPVLLWLISEQDEKSLDRYEGFPKYYVKKDFRVTLPEKNGKKRTVDAMGYVMAPGYQISPPADGYFKTILDGYRHLGFDRNTLIAAVENAKEEASA